ncbi:MAG: YCF48-related protein, partial [Dehalococcoidia bacterium]
MSQYVIRRILLIFPTLFIASLLVAAMVRLLPGDVIDIMVAGGRGGRVIATEEAREFTRVKLGLEKPFHIQYIRWMFGWPKTEGEVFKTSDAGATWKRLGADTIKLFPFTDVTFMSTTIGWALAENLIFGTTNGGSEWSRQHKGDNSLNAIAFVDEENGWAVGDKGTILHTTEGGASSIGEEGELLSSWVSQNSNTSQRLTDVAFVDTETGWVVGDGGLISHTVDAGAGWEEQNSGTETKLSSVAFYDARNGWAVGDGGLILHTVDGGAGWEEQNSGTSKHLNDITLAGPLHLWAVGDKGTVLRSSDGGFSWIPHTISEDVGQKLTSVAFGDENNGMIAGHDGLILTTADGGATWSRQEIVITKRQGDTTIQEDPTTKPIRDISLLVTPAGTVRAWAPAVERSWKWGLIGGNLGERFTLGGRAVTGELARTFGPSLQLMIMSTIFALSIAIPVGIFSAIRQDTIGDYAGRTFAISGLAVP